MELAATLLHVYNGVGLTWRILMEQCITIGVYGFAFVGCVYIAKKMVDLVQWVMEKDRQIGLLDYHTKSLDKRLDDYRDDLWKIRHELAALKKVKDGGP